MPKKVNQVLHTKWVFKIKMDAYEKIEPFKSRLAACGNEQVFGIEYGLTFAAVMEVSALNIILMLALRWKLLVRHGDIPNANVKANKEKNLEIFSPTTRYDCTRCNLKQLEIRSPATNRRLGFKVALKP